MAINGELAIVTGATGFLGRHLVDLLLRQGYRVLAITQPDDPLLPTLHKAAMHQSSDIRDVAALTRILLDTAPARIFHLAGMARGSDLNQLLSINVMGTDCLLQAASKVAPPPSVVIPGSAAEYGLACEQQPIDESALPRPTSAYGLSKLAQTLHALSYAWRGEVPVVVGRVFNVTGPGEPPSMVCGSIVAQIVAAERGEQPPLLRLGNLSSMRDFIDVRDVAQALLALAIAGEPGQVYNVCTGVGHTVEQIVSILLRLSTISIACESEPARRRVWDIPVCVGNPGRLQKATAWRPLIPVEKSLEDSLHWRRSIQ